MRRRHWLQLGVLSGALLAVGGGAALALGPEPDRTRLSPDGRQVFSAVAAALLDGSLPTADPQRSRAIDQLLERIDGLIANLPAHAQAELAQLLSLMSNPMGRRALTGLTSAWAEASPSAVQAALQSLRTSSVSLRQQAYHALHDITAGAYFADPSTWPMLGYPGPQAV